MRNVKWLAAAGLLVSATGCMDLNGYPGTSYPNSYGYSGGYPGGVSPQPANGVGVLLGLLGQPGYAQPAPNYYQPAPAYYPQAQPAYYPQAQPTYYPQTQPRYVPVPVASGQTASTRPWGGGRDRNSNGVPDWKERDRNGDGVPDYQQRRRGPTG